MKAKRLSDFVGVSRRGWKGGTTCRTCAHKDIKEIDADIKEYAALKANGVEVDGRAEPFLMPFAAFVRERLQKKYGYSYLPGTAREHASRCLGLVV